jgi:hypothetical protein
LDYLWAYRETVIPVEVRAGTSGNLKLLQVFRAEKEQNFAVRFNMNRPSLGSFSAAAGGKGGVWNVSFALLSAPPRSARQLDRMLQKYLCRRWGVRDISFRSSGCGRTQRTQRWAFARGVRFVHLSLRSRRYG